MKVYISIDLEGVCGVVADEQVTAGNHEYNRARALMTAEANAAIEGALKAGAAEILVNDSHAGMRNVLIEELRPEAQLITGAPKPLSMMEGIDESFDAAVLIGYHAMAGTRGVLNHTYSGKAVRLLRINGRPMGETGLNAGIAGYFGVPVVMVSGDSSTAAQARELLGDIETVAVKEEVGRYAARNLHPTRARELIRDAVTRGLKRVREIEPFAVDAPVTFELTFAGTAMADAAELIPGVARMDELTVAYASDDYIISFKAMRAMIALALS